MLELSIRRMRIGMIYITYPDHETLGRVAFAPRHAGQQLMTSLVMAALIAVAGCGSASSANDAGNAGGKDLQAFIGTWIPMPSSEITLTCAGQTMNDQVTDNATWQMGVTSDLVQPPDASGCTLLANVSGKIATGLPNQKCNQATFNLSISSYSFSVGADGTTANESATGTAMATNGASCTYSERATYTKSH